MCYINIMLKMLIFPFLLLFGAINMASAEPANHLVISEIRIGGESAYDEYVILYNPTLAPISIEGFRLTKKAASGTEYTLVSAFTAQIINPDDYLTISHPQSAYESLKYSTKNSMASDNTIVLYDRAKNVVDKVGFGKASDFETQAAVPLLKDQILSRKDNIDTDNNANDFQIETENVPEQNVTTSTDHNQDSQVLINEVYPDPLSTESESKDEWVELFNPNNFEVDISGWSLEDKRGSVNKFIMQPQTKISPNGYLVLNNSLTKIALNNDGDELILRNTAGSEISSSPDYGDTESGLSFAFFDESWVWTKKVTKGSINIKEEVTEKEASLDAAVSSTSKKTTSTKQTKPKTSASSTSSKAKKTSTSSKSTSKKAEVLGASTEPEDDLGEKDLKKGDNLGILFVLGGVVLASGYLAYINRGDIEEKIYN
ncbi:TPA: hypothetical protein DDW69_02780 [candidate division CPR2 bacterium]|uniref:LTD domain-containing protein n=1 Tax=candidate division CPR2 bacterium GW2011_GWC1_41_48 TaxID=1618344 RepID=A0A0G0YI22_UNCC2|nr:MAG: hypothetical protein UT47_C0003G0242 [candidate division CPR2 bacterium GW2011_GWC2_39_35]KKR29285.1 MAG: hypothetical protein UT60_C0004G0022 [candidate division CPR2 bacterium GW2011_GWD2_39_7]KKR29645.1 MAG: hypothetical protein UT59_C0002G0004 [candidate division CPR2 bacterium GW2011_GWD1_39_7]KKS09181.1 MAG: hypothetical protein UU65_C0003G0236 [candidate division CPR2 bacterium GW2011_GWC1_41_48]OGB56933.1 MAG: hypothetical protein A2Y27_02325 [candidate division CPR2 bacterium G